jgi:hypothetical protein
MASNNTFALFSGLFLPLAVAAGASLVLGGAGCGTDRACFHFTEAEYELDKSCPSQAEALDFFQDPFCSSPITSVDSAGTFEGDTCCYDVTESSDPFNTTCVPGGFAAGPQTAVGVSVGGVGGAGGIGGAGGMGGAGAGGNVNCSRCKQFMLETDPLPLCDVSIPLYQALTDCRCVNGGACFPACASTACMNTTPSMECDACMLDSTDGCGTEFLACTQDE